MLSIFDFFSNIKSAVRVLYHSIFSIRQRCSFVYSAISRGLPLDIIGYVGSIFWISGAFGPRVIRPDQAPYIGDYTWIISPGVASTLFIGIALAIHILVPFIYFVVAGPFTVRADWYPMSTDSKVHRAKMRGDLRLESSGPTRVVVPIEVIEHSRSYKLEFSSTSPLEIGFMDEPNDDQDWDRDDKILSSEEVVHYTFTPVFEIEEIDGLGTGGNHNISVTHEGMLRSKKLLKIPVVE